MFCYKPARIFFTVFIIIVISIAKRKKQKMKVPSVNNYQSKTNFEGLAIKNGVAIHFLDGKDIGKVVSEPHIEKGESYYLINLFDKANKTVLYTIRKGIRGAKEFLSSLKRAVNQAKTTNGEDIVFDEKTGKIMVPTGPTLPDIA